MLQILRSAPAFGAALLVALAAAACADPSVTIAPSTSAEPFRDQTTTLARPEFRVTSDGAPLSGVLIHLREKSGDGTAGAVVLSMLTGADGVARGTVTLASADEELEVVVIKPGYQGALPDEVAEQLGAFAPASRFTVPADSLSVEVDLDRKETL